MATLTLPPATGPTAAPAPDPVRNRSALLHRAGLGVLLLGTAVLYLWGLSASGYANSYYSAAVQAGSQSRRPSCSARWTPGTRSRSTSRRPRCG